MFFSEYLLTETCMIIDALCVVKRVITTAYLLIVVLKKRKDVTFWVLKRAQQRGGKLIHVK